MTVELIITCVVVGVVLILVEVFVPGGIVGGLGLLFLIAGIVAAFSHSLMFGLGLLLGSLVLGLAAFWAWLRFFPGTNMGKRLILQRDAHTWHSYDHNADLVGKEGVTNSPLHPTGIAMIENRRLDVVTRGEMLAPGTAIEVIDVEGNRIVVATKKATADKA